MPHTRKAMGHERSNKVIKPTSQDKWGTRNSRLNISGAAVDPKYAQIYKIMRRTPSIDTH